MLSPLEFTSCQSLQICNIICYTLTHNLISALKANPFHYHIWHWLEWFLKIKGLFLWRLWHCQSLSNLCIIAPVLLNNMASLLWYNCSIEHSIHHTAGKQWSTPFNPLLENPYSCHTEPILVATFSWLHEDSSRFSQVIRLVTEQLHMYLTSLVTIYTTLWWHSKSTLQTPGTRGIVWQGEYEWWCVFQFHCRDGLAISTVSRIAPQFCGLV